MFWSLILRLIIPQAIDVTIFAVAATLLKGRDLLVSQIIGVVAVLIAAWFWFPAAWRGMEIVTMFYAVGFFGVHVVLAIGAQLIVGASREFS